MSLTSAVVKELIAAGITGDALVAACERIEAASKAARSKGAERTARWRERRDQRHSDVTCDGKDVTTKRHGDVTASHPSPLVPPFPPAPPIPPIIPPSRAELCLSARELEAKLRDAAGWQNEPHPGLIVTGPIEELIAAGADLELDVLPVIRGRAQNVRRPTGWKYFIGPIQDAVAARKSASTGPPLKVVNGSRPPEKSFDELAKELVPGWTPGTKTASNTA